MRTNIPEKLLNITEEIEETGQANLTRLTVLKNGLFIRIDWRHLPYLSLKGLVVAKANQHPKR